MRPFGDHFEEPALLVPAPHIWQPRRNDMPTGDNGIAETQNRQTNLINLSPMFARRVLQSGTRPNAGGGLPLLT